LAVKRWDRRGDEMEVASTGILDCQGGTVRWGFGLALKLCCCRKYFKSRSCITVNECVLQNKKALSESTCCLIYISLTERLVRYSDSHN
jgi:hypothetical protein